MGSKASKMFYVDVDIYELAKLMYPQKVSALVNGFLKSLVSNHTVEYPDEARRKDLIDEKTQYAEDFQRIKARISEIDAKIAEMDKKTDEQKKEYVDEAIKRLQTFKNTGLHRRRDIWKSK